MYTLEFFQGELEAIYGVEAPRVRDYLMDRAQAEALFGPPPSPEALLVRESEGEIELGLFLDDEVVEAARTADPHDPRPLLTLPGALGPLACAAEGVSHFVYLATRAARGRPVSLLELEVQAEVDRFALLVLYLWRRGLRRLSPALRSTLFGRVRYRATLVEEELERYRLANRLGGGYARFLEASYVRGADAEGMLRELRQSYRLGGGEKLGYLGARAGRHEA
ncbi:MAG TPA: hypothetical protein VLV17_04285 [Anaeromyxobacteraceae bacterium]|nr:hypothetical protein [Anaeromyxobacteraceae bacterium]HUK66021.1 hypothetical protein [Anaeromyxobacteraceae bacterium]